MFELAGKKIGMTHLFEDENLVPLTLVQLHESCVIEIVPGGEGKDDRVLVGFKKILNHQKKVNKSVSGVFLKKSLPVFKTIRSLNIKNGSNLKVGEALPFDLLLKKGDLVDISGVSMGKGFAGVMKRWNFRGLEASHGVSVSHRSHGSTGQRQDPGKVFKGKKMAGHMGVDKITVKNLKVIVIDKDKLLVALHGAVPGGKGGDIVLKIAKNL